ncbi:tripartite motif-containing protein 29-like [Mytilus edulis]|uniref:tripartite motif-containing protein 29-like n=1 Tax=Mytilus edulis TaxID=6550 RepID=UPI0039F0D1F6
MSDLIICGPCGYADNSRNAEKWCTACGEGLCTDCEQVHKSIGTTRNHRLISTDDFRQIKNISISLSCKGHDKRLELYCKTHDVAVCLGCVPSHHRACSDVIPLEKAAENAKNSTALDDLEDTLTIALKSLQQIIIDRAACMEN